MMTDYHLQAMAHNLYTVQRRGPTLGGAMYQDQTTCRYPSKICTNPRAHKSNGELHRFCEHHRRRANMNQKRWSTSRRGYCVSSPPAAVTTEQQCHRGFDEALAKATSAACEGLLSDVDSVLDQLLKEDALLGEALLLFANEYAVPDGSVPGRLAFDSVEDSVELDWSRLVPDAQGSWL